MRALVLGLLASFFFAFTFVLNRAMDIGGGSWVWSASLRYLFMAPMMILLVAMRSQLAPVWQALRARPLLWLGWSFVGFVLFYAPISFAAAFGPGWLVAGTWQITIVCGSLLVPLFGQRIPMKGLLMSLIILLGVALMQVEHAGEISGRDVVLGIVPVVIAAFAYPLGNRKMMGAVAGQLDAYQRVLGMTVASLPFWLLLSVYGIWTDGLPSLAQTGQSAIVAFTSGVLATVIFFTATDLVRSDPAKLAAVEATQAGEVVFAVVGEVLLLSAVMPSLLSWIGMVIVMAGMVLHSYVSIPKRSIAEKAPAL
ncbi:DMT family transporter [Tumebacillus permanentifrigoris]|uniref:Putative multidrug resistance efflux transporter n=1 Tax=Tumebacillus permanentifrigoris TaxID=378543 RepID=A0A316D919_9BACL|nr:multidrug resistance efflux transporter family protein [Tumebacillus permanentifrigoris]PWK13117.1 putative multidrug resistance efflux transporter [Tumebacillus permanentifrigoris]